MRHLVAGLARKPLQAQRIIDDLISLCACERADISVMSGEQAAPQVPGMEAAAQAAKGAGALLGGALQQISGFASGITSRAIPGVGVFNAAGQLASVLSKSAFGTARELAEGLAAFGLREGLAAHYAEAMRNGAILVLVEARTDKMAQCARDTMASHGAVLAEEHA